MKDPATDKGLNETEKHTSYKTVSLKQLAAHLGLNPATISVVLNDVPGRSIPQATRDRIKIAANRAFWRVLCGTSEHKRLASSCLNWATDITPR
jgi:hypothetical protein